MLKILESLENKKITGELYRFLKKLKESRQGIISYNTSIYLDNYNWSDSYENEAKCVAEYLKDNLLDLNKEFIKVYNVYRPHGGVGLVLEGWLGKYYLIDRELDVLLSTQPYHTKKESVIKIIKLSDKKYDRILGKNVN